MIPEETQLAAAIGSKMLEWRGSDVLEVVYLLQEKKALDALREINRLSERNKNKLIRFMQKLDDQDDIELKTSCSEIALKPKPHLRKQ